MMCVAGIDNIELIKKIVTLSGLRWKVIAKIAPSAEESVESKDVFKRLVSVHLIFVLISVTF